MGPIDTQQMGLIIMESPAVLLFLPIFFAVHIGMRLYPYSSVCCGKHYIHRTYIYPFRIRTLQNRCQ